MPRKDIYHDAVKNALIKDGWIITEDPLILSFETRALYVDLGAQCVVAAEKAEQQIAVEVKSFVNPSEIHDLENALGQYVLYRTLLKRKEADRKLYLAIEQDTYKGVFSEPIGKAVLEDEQINLMVFDKSEEVIVKWMN